MQRIPPLNEENRFEIERRRFPVTERFAYLDHACRGPLSPPAHEMVLRVAEEMRYVHPDGLERMHEDFDVARQGMADLIGAPKSSIGFILNVSSGLSMAANSLPIEAGDNVVCARGEFPANIYPWMNLARRGVEVRFIEPGPEGPEPDLVREAMDGRTKAVALSWVSYANGARIDTAAIGGLCRDRNVRFVVDAIQGVGALKVDLGGIDILVCGGGKWALSPQGGGFIHIRPELIEHLHPDRVGWLSMAAFADLEGYYRMTDYRFELANDARRMETGSNCTLTQRALGASCRYFCDLNPESIEDRIVHLCDYLIEGLQRKGMPVTSPLVPERRSGIVCFAPPDPQATAKRLIEKDVIVSAREGSIRVGIHFYNNEEDLDRLLELL